MLALYGGFLARRAPKPDSPRFIGAAPTIAAAPIVGVSVGLTGLVYYGSPTITVTYQWKLDGANISGATSSTVTPAATGALTCAITLTGPAGTTPVSLTTAARTVASTGGTGSVTLPTFLVPERDGDNSALTDFSASRVSWSTTSGDYSLGSQDFGGTGLISATVTGLNIGTTYYFAVFAVDSSGNVSTPSSEYSAVAA